MSEPGEPTNLVLEHLRGIREELQKTNDRLDRVEAVQQDHGGALTKLIDAVTELAKTSAKHTDLLIDHSKKLETIQGTQVVIEKESDGARHQGAPVS